MTDFRIKRPIRSMLFVPGNKPSWITKAVDSNADAIVLDLEDSVPFSEKDAARSITAEAVSEYSCDRTLLYVRINKGSHIYSFDDLEAVVQPTLHGIFVPKADNAQDIDFLSKMICEIEERLAMKAGKIQLVVALETARSVEFAYEIASHPRVETLVVAAAKNADVSRNLGFQWTMEGLETIYHRSRTVIACRAADKPFPIGGLWQDVHNLEGLKQFARFNRQLGFCGEIVLHPSNVAIVNEIYSLSEEDRTYYKEMIKAFAAAEAEGRASVMYKGEHIDIAHITTAREVLNINES